jgi:putative membrane protein
VSTPDAAELQWRRVHPVTPFVRGWAVLAAALVIFSQQGIDDVARGEGIVELARSDFWWTIPGALVLIAAVAFGYAVLAWRMTAYSVGEDTVHLRKGVLFRQQRHARLDRLQAVDVRQPVLARLFALAELRLEVAGGGDSGVVIGFLKEPDARQLRAELLARAAGLKARRGVPVAQPARPEPVGGPGEPVAPGVAPDAVGRDDSVATDTSLAPATASSPDAAAAAQVPADAVRLADAEAELAPEAPETQVYDVPPGRLIVSALRSGGVLFTLLILVGLVVAVAVTRNVGILLSAAPFALGAGGYLFQRFSGEFGFRAAISPDGIRLRHGLLETRAQTIPPGRVQAVSFTQGLWWRGPDWWRVQVNVAGYGLSGNETQNVLLPVGTRDEALTALWLVLPDLGADDPRRLLDEGLSGTSTTSDLFVASPPRARLLDPVGWRRNGFAVTERALLLRHGRVVRRLEVVPHERTQSLAVEQGPWQRRRRLASFAVHSTPGPVSPMAPHLDADDAGRLLQEQAARARSARAHAGPERWMEDRR